jgi:hypothetical protein
MIKKLKTLITNLSLASLFVVPLLAPAAVQAQDVDPQAGVCTGAETLQLPDTGTDPDTACTDPDAEANVNQLIRTVINIFSVIVGVIAVIMIIYGGFKYITSGGDSGKISAAQQTIIYAIVGLIIVALAQIVVRFVLSRAVGTAAA